MSNRLVPATLVTLAIILSPTLATGQPPLPTPETPGPAYAGAPAVPGEASEQPPAFWTIVRLVSVALDTMIDDDISAEQIEAILQTSVDSADRRLNGFDQRMNGFDSRLSSLETQGRLVTELLLEINQKVTALEER